MDVPAGDPVVQFLELIIRIRQIKFGQEEQRKGEFGDRGCQSDPANPHVVVRAQQ